MSHARFMMYYAHGIIQNVFFSFFFLKVSKRCQVFGKDPSRHLKLKHGWGCGRQKKRWVDNVKDCTSLPMPDWLTMASCSKDWKRNLCWIILPLPPLAKNPTGPGTELDVGEGIYCLWQWEEWSEKRGSLSSGSSPTESNFSTLWGS